jgi:transcriptional regulator with XRE-family HTH domain
MSCLLLFIVYLIDKLGYLFPRSPIFPLHDFLGRCHNILCVWRNFGMITATDSRLVARRTLIKTTLSVGERLRLLRTKRNLSQRALAKAAGISTNSVSLIERNEISPSIATIQNLATAMHVRISFFFEDETEQSVVHIKPDQRSSIDSQGVRIESTGSRIYEQEIEPFLVKLAPRTSSGERHVIHTGHEVVFCLKGKLEYLIDGNTYQIEAGDFLLFDASLPHLWRNPFDADAEFLLILQTPGAKLEPVKRHFVEYPSITHID